MATIDPWLWAQTWGETVAAGLDPEGLALRQRDARLARLLAQAHELSPLYRSRQRAKAVPPLDALEPVDKAELMRRFDDWATDRRITRASVDAFVRDPARVAGAYLDDYLVWTSSGTTGEPGIFVQDAQSLAAWDSLSALRLRGGGAATFGAGPAWGAGQRFAYVAATGGHFAGLASIERLRRLGAGWSAPWSAGWAAWWAPTLQIFSVQEPVAALVEQLQAFAPSVLVTYPSCADALAQAQSEGRLKLRLSEVWVGGEQLSPEQRMRIRSAFGCPLRNSYGASECYAMAWECAEGRLHLNHDWVILEPVDREGRAVPPGAASHAVLLTNLANRAQPLLRYALSDSVRLLSSRCACGSRFPTLEVHGRADHTLRMQDAQRREVTLLPLALCTAVEEGAQVTRFQVLRTAADRLELRFETEVADPGAAFRRTKAALDAWLAAQGLSNVRVSHGRAPPLHHPRSGKVERVRLAEGTA